MPKRNKSKKIVEKKGKKIKVHIYKMFTYKGKDYFGNKIVDEALAKYIVDTKKGEIIGNS